MNEDKEQISEEFDDLKKELEEFKKEKERIRGIVGKIGGVPSFNSKAANVIFFLLVLVSLVISLLTTDILRYAMIDVAIAILSLKIIYLIHCLTRENHFELWVLSTLEWQVNEIRKDIRKINK